MSKRKGFIIGTKFYRHINDSPIPDIIRLTKIENDRFFVNDGGYTTTIDKKDIDEAVKNGEFTKVCSTTLRTSDGHLYESPSNYIRHFKFFNTPITQVWTPTHTIVGDELFIEFKVAVQGFIMTYENLIENYTLLTPDGMITMCNASYKDEQTGKITTAPVITAHKKMENTPYAVCRPDVVDIFTMTNSHYVHLGLSISQRTLPTGMEIYQFLEAEQATNFKACAYYCDDSLSDIFRAIGSTKKYDVTMRRTYDRFKGTNFILKDNNLYEFAVNSGFYDELLSMTGIYKFPFELPLRTNKMNDTLSLVFNRAINPSKGYECVDIEYVPYDKTIDLNSIEADHCVIATGDAKHPKLFVVTYGLAKITND
mgnify:FL=1